MDAESRSRSQLLNPMLNPVVLTTLFEVSDLSDLFNYRLVSKDWYRLSLARFRNEATVQICLPLWDPAQGLPCPGAEEFDKKSLQWKHEELGKNLSVDDGKPYQSYHIHNVDSISKPYPIILSESYYNNMYLTKEEITEEQVAILFKNMTEFWPTFGKNIRRLHLTTSVYCVKSFKKVIFEDTPNLEELYLEAMLEGIAAEQDWIDDGVGPGGVVKMQRNLKTLIIRIDELFPVTWRLLVSHFPNIQKLNILDLEYCQEFLLGFVTTLEEMSRNEDLKWKVTDLALESGGFPHPMPILKLVQLPLFTLSKLSLDAKYFGEEWKSVFRTAMQFHGDTLTELCVSQSFTCNCKCHIHRNEIDTTPLEQFPYFPFHPRCFPSLTKLEVVGEMVPNFHFVEHFPNLRILRVKYSLEATLLEETDWTRMENVRLPYLHEFKFDTDNNEDDCVISGDVMQVLVKMMPNVSHLGASLNDDSLRVVCENWRCMRELEIWSDSVTNEGITGIVKFEEEPRPNITDLKDLRKLKVTSAAVCLSDKSVSSAILKLPILRILDIQLSSDTIRRWRRGGDEALKALIQLIPEGSIDEDDDDLVVEF